MIECRYGDRVVPGQESTKPGHPGKVPANSSILMGSSLRLCRERELPLIQLSFKVGQELVGDQLIVLHRFAFRVEIHEESAAAGGLGHR